MLTPKAEILINIGKGNAFRSRKTAIDIPSLLYAIANHNEAKSLLAECLNIQPSQIENKFDQDSDNSQNIELMSMDEKVRDILSIAKQLAEEIYLRTYPGLIDIRHVVVATAMSIDACILLNTSRIDKLKATSFLQSLAERDVLRPGIEELSDKLQMLRTDLLGKIFGQNHAVQAFIDGLFNSEVLAGSDEKRRAPQAIFVFAGPPGVGKTFLAETGASYLERPFKRFDMSAFSGHYQDESLVGMPKNYQGAHPGQLTEFVEKNPLAVLLFDEIEKAHPKTISLFLQVLDSGTLEDKYNEKNVYFKNTVVIFTTNAGKDLYNKKDRLNYYSSNSQFHKRTLLDALRNEYNEQTNQPLFPDALISRFATGYPILFNRLGISDLDKIVKKELVRTSELLQLQYYKKVSFDDFISMSLILREGSESDARSLRSQTENFIKTELFRFCELFRTDRIESVFDQFDSLHFCLDKGIDAQDAAIRELFETKEREQILYIGNGQNIDNYLKSMQNVNWVIANTQENVMEILASQEMFIVLIDLFLGQTIVDMSATIHHFDHLPLAARGLGAGQEILRKIHERFPGLPVYIVSIRNDDTKRGIDDEFLLSCRRAGGARGIVEFDISKKDAERIEKELEYFKNNLNAIIQSIHREKVVERLSREGLCLSFDAVPEFKKASRSVRIRIRNLRLARAIKATDVGEIIEEVDRPQINFNDVFGADSAKEELQFFVEYLRNPKRYAATGLKPPKGILLYGPPGTGKTMLARAMAGECGVAFISISASNFVTIWQGSGPQNIRNVFERARRYAPSIIFIDEIDAIGRLRTGGAGSSQAYETTLNALLVEMDGFSSPSPDRPIFLLAATNASIEDNNDSNVIIDPALVRRFTRNILVDLPSREARKKYLEKRLLNRPDDLITKPCVELLSERSSGMSIANLDIIIETAVRNAVRKSQKLCDQFLEEAFDQVSFGERKKWSASDIERTAKHEAGHTILYWIAGFWPTYVTIVSRGRFGGYMAPSSEEIENSFGRTKRQILERIRVSLAGRAAEIMYYGPEEGLSTGAEEDLKNATRLAKDMICRSGMDEEIGPVSISEISYRSANCNGVAKIDDRIRQIMLSEMEKTRLLLQEHREKVDTIVEALIRKERLTMEDLKYILPQLSGQFSSSSAANKQL